MYRPIGADSNQLTQLIYHEPRRLKALMLYTKKAKYRRRELESPWICRSETRDTKGTI